jgi:hypothetical protein
MLYQAIATRYGPAWLISHVRSQPVLPRINQLETVISGAIILNDIFVKNDGEDYDCRKTWVGKPPIVGARAQRCPIRACLRLRVSGGLLGLQYPASAASDNSSNTYAADANGIVIPTGTLLAIEYLGVRESDTYVTSGDNIFAKLGAGHNIDSDFELFTSITRFVYFTKLFDHPLAVEAAFTGVNVSEANIGNLQAHDPVTGLGPQTVEDGFADPVFFLSYGLIAAPKDERFLVPSNYLYVRGGVTINSRTSTSHRPSSSPECRNLRSRRGSRNTASRISGWM